MMTLIADVTPKLRTPKNMVRSMPKKSRFGWSSKSNMVNALKHCSNLEDTSLPYLLITGKSIALEKVSVSDIQNLKTVS